MAGFRNTLFNEKEWQKYVGSSKREYADGTYFEEGDKYAVYDGGQGQKRHGRGRCRRRKRP